MQYTFHLKTNGYFVFLAVGQERHFSERYDVIKVGRVTFSKRSYFFGFLYVLHGVKPSKILDLSLGSLSNDDGDGNKNGKKAIGLDW